MVNIDDMSIESIEAHLERKKKERTPKEVADLRIETKQNYTIVDGKDVFYRHSPPLKFTNYILLGWVSKKRVPEGYKIVCEEDGLSRFIDIKLVKE